jgi:SAM-dependent methyltransferase
MAALGARVTANDISSSSERIISEASAKLAFENVKPVCGDFATLNFASQSFDFVIGKLFLHHLTHELERIYLKKVARVLKPDGEARFFEPAVNSQYLDRRRWMMPVPGRPSILSRKAFAQWKQQDPHSDRDNSSSHFLHIGRTLFREVEIVPIGSLERLCRLMPRGQWTRRYRRFAHRVETRLPRWFRDTAARSQLIIYRFPVIDVECSE